MKTRSYLVLIPLLASLLLLSSCQKGGGDFGHASSAGSFPEEFLPEDTGMVFSYSTLDDGQFDLLADLQARIGDEDKFSRAFAESVTGGFEGLDLDFDRDMAPAFGDQFRMVFAGTPGTTEGQVEAYSIVTLEKPEQMAKVFDKLEEFGEIEKKKLSSFDAYINEESQFYATIHNEFLFVTNVPENLTEMVSQNSKHSLWNTKEYQSDLKRIGSDQIFYVLLYPGKVASGVNLPTGLSLANLPEIINNQALVIRADEDGFAFDGYAVMDKKKADEAGVSFDNVPKAKAYLQNEVPADGLMAYIESYALKQGLEQAMELGTEAESLAQFETTVQNFLGMDLQEEILTFVDKGYVVAAHQNAGSILPGFSIYADISSDPANAQRFVDKIDGQLTGFMTVLQTALPGAVTKSSTTVQGESLTSVVVDLNAAPNVHSIPDYLKEVPMKLSFGLIGDRLLVTTADVWEKDAASIGDDELFDILTSKLDGVDEGMILLNLQGFVDYVGLLQQVRGELDLEEANPVESVDIEDLLQGMKGGILMSKTKPYETRLGGFFMISE